MKRKSRQPDVKSAINDDLQELEKDIKPEELLRELEMRSAAKNAKPEQ